jgi:hypothetical protein
MVYGMCKKYSFEELCSILNEHGIVYDTVSNALIRAYCYAHSNDFDTVRLSEFGEVVINGRIANLYAWLGY